MSEPVLLQTVDARGIARLTLNRPEVRNAFNEELIGAIAEGVATMSGDGAVRVIVLTGAGQAFSAGADLSMMKRIGELSPGANTKDAGGLAAMFRSVQSSSKPVIALVNGPAMGGGVGLVAACDIAIGSETAFFALSEVRLGLIPAVISPFVVAAIGARQARRFFLTGERIDAETARRFGLLHMVAMPEQLEATLEGVASNILQCGPLALGEAKRLVADVAGRPITDELIGDLAERIARLRASEEGQEGLAAFLQKRKPAWIK